MTQDQSALLDLLELLRTADDGSVMRRLLTHALQELIEAEATAAIGAVRHQRTETRTTQRNGSRHKTITTAAGDVTVEIPKTRTGSFFPSLLEPRRRIDRALHAVICEAYVHGVSTRKVHDLVTAMGGLSGVSKSEVSRICAQLDARGRRLASRPLDEIVFPYLFVDATYCKVRVGGRVVSQAVVVATGVSADGRREVLGHAVGDSETEALWAEFLRSLRDRGLGGVQLVISDAHRASSPPSGRCCKAPPGSDAGSITCATCSPKSERATPTWVAAATRTVFAQPTGPLARAQVEEVARLLEPKFPAVTSMLLEAKADITAFARLPRGALEEDVVDHPLERLKRRSSAAPTSSASSPTRLRCTASPAPSWSKPTSSGRPPTGATCPKPAWPPCSPPRPHGRHHHPRRSTNPSSPSHNQHHTEPNANVDLHAMGLHRATTGSPVSSTTNRPSGTV